jgi:hypothetical protein
MVPVGRGVTHEYQEPFSSFTCCVGTGMENHALLGDGLFYESRTPKETRLWVNFYTPCHADWKKERVKLDMETTFPDGETAALKITVTGDGILGLAPVRDFTLALRRPSWAGSNFSVTVNGEPVKHLTGPGSYVEINRAWKTGDTVALVLPKQLREEPLPDGPHRVALLWGPLVLAGDLGPERRGRAASNNVPVLVGEGIPLEQWLKPVEGQPGDFDTVGAGRDHDVRLVPFYRLHERTYTAYWEAFSPVAQAGHRRLCSARPDAGGARRQRAGLRPGGKHAGGNHGPFRPPRHQVVFLRHRGGCRASDDVGLHLLRRRMAQADGRRAGGRPQNRRANHRGARRTEIL